MLAQALDLLPHGLRPDQGRLVGADLLQVVEDLQHDRLECCVAVALDERLGEVFDSDVHASTQAGHPASQVALLARKETRVCIHVACVLREAAPDPKVEGRHAEVGLNLA